MIRDWAEAPPSTAAPADAAEWRPAGNPDRHVALPGAATEGVPFARRGRRHWFRFLLGIVVSLGCLALAFRHVSPSRVADAFATVSPLWVALSVVAVVPAFAATTMRWRLLLAPSGGVSPWRAGRLLAIAYLLNLILPARPGDLLRAYLVGKPKGPPVGVALTTIVVEKALDGVAVVLVMLVLLTQAPAPAWLRQGVGAAALLFGAILAAALFAGAGRLARLRGFLSRRPTRAGRLATAAVGQAQLGAQAIANGRSLLVVFALTAAVWCASLATAYALAQAFHLDVPAALPALALAAATLGLVVPAAPGGVGPYQVLVMATLTPAGVAPASAFSYGLALQFCQILPLAVLGAVAALPYAFGPMWVQRQARQNSAT